MVLKAVQFSFFLLSFSSFAQIEKSVYYSHQSHIYFDQDRLKEAELYADSALYLAIRSTIPDSIASAYRWMYVVHLGKKDFQKALQDYRMAMIYRDSVLTIRNNIIAFERDSIHVKEVEAHNLELNGLRSDITRLKNMADQDRRNSLTIFLGMLAFLMIVIFVFYRRNAQLTASLEKSKGDMTDVDAFKSKLYSVLSKDVNDALTAFDQITTASSTEVQTPLLTLIHQSSHNLKVTLSHVIQWMSYQANEKPVNPIAFDCKTLTDEVLERFRSRLEEKRIMVDMFIPEAQNAFADRDMVAIVLDNLIANAIRYTEPDGRISFFSGRKDDLVTLGIKDSGIGISVEHMQGLFTIVKDFHDHDSGKEDQAGIGLVLSRDLIERNGGRMYAESVEGKGSTFYFTVPGKKID